MKESGNPTYAPLSADDHEHHRWGGWREKPEHGDDAAGDRAELPVVVLVVEVDGREDGDEEEVGAGQAAQHHRGERHAADAAEDAEDDEGVAHEADADDDPVDGEDDDVEHPKQDETIVSNNIRRAWF